MTHEAFEHIAQELRPRLLGIGRRFFHEEETAEDIAQETLMRLWLVREQIDPQMGIEPLAQRMAKNLCVSEWRKRQVRHTVQQHAATLSQPDTTTQQLEAKEAIARLREAISLLSPAEQRLFRMRHEAEMDTAQIAAVTGIDPRSVSAMLSTAKRKLKDILNKKGGLL